MAETQIALVCTIADPEEQRQMLAEVYGYLIELARQRRAERQVAYKEPSLSSGYGLGSPDHK